MYRQKRRRENAHNGSAPLDQDQIARLDALGVQWLQKGWLQNYKRLDQVLKRNRGKIPRKKKYEALRKWVYAQRVRRKASYKGERRLGQTQLDKLKELDLDWSDFDSDDEESISGDSSSSSSSESDSDSDGESTITSSPRLGAPACGSERAEHEKSWLAFERYFSELYRFRSFYGHCNVPNTVEWIHLSYWLYRMKRCRDGPYHGSPRLTERQIGRMEDLGVTWLEDDVEQKDTVEGNEIPMDQKDGFFCKVKLLQNALVAKEVGFIVLPSRETSSFVDARRRIMDTVSFPEWFSNETGEWFFYIPSRGPLSMQEEVTSGSMYKFLRQLGPISNFSAFGDAEVLIVSNCSSLL